MRKGSAGPGSVRLVFCVCVLFVSLVLREVFAQVSALLFPLRLSLEKVPLEVGLGVIAIQLSHASLRLAPLRAQRHAAATRAAHELLYRDLHQKKRAQAILCFHGFAVLRAV